MRKGLLEILMLALVLAMGSAQAVELELIGPGAGFQDISANGATVLLFDGSTANAFLWTAETGLTWIGTSDSNAPIYEISGDATTVVGTMEHDGLKQASTWTEADGWTGLGNTSIGCSLDGGTSSGWGISGDGSVAVGLAWTTVGTHCKARAMRWTEETGVVLLETTNVDGNSRASAVSGDGTVAVGWTEAPFGTWQPTWWDADGNEHILAAEPEAWSEALGANGDGTVVVGELEDHAFRWTEATGIVDLGPVPGAPGTESRAVGVSADGNTIVGWGGTPPINLHAFVWTASGGMQNLDQLVADAGIDLEGFSFVSHATAVSADGSTIVGAIFNPQTFNYQAYRLRIAPPLVAPIPDGGDPAYGAPLEIEKQPFGQIRLTWSLTCLGTETDYGIYEGSLGDFTSHSRRRCGTSGATETTFAAPSGDAYYLVVPYNGDYEASYGTDSSGVPRVVGTTTCTAEQTTGSCE